MFAIAAGIAIRDAIAGGPMPAVQGFALAGVIGLAAVALLVGLAPETGRLRIAELAVFGAMAAFLAVRGYFAIGVPAGPGATLPAWNSLVLHFVLLLAAYAMLVTNTAVRAAIGVVLIGAVPMVIIAVLRSKGEAAAIGGGAIGSAAIALGLGVLVATAGAAFLSLFRGIAFREKELGMYDLDYKIGEGGMGEVWLAHHQRLARPAAVKLIRASRLEDVRQDQIDRLMGRFEREAQATAALRSPNTIEIYDFGQSSQGIFYYVMEYVDGLTMEALVKDFGPVPPARAIYLLRQACESLGEAHDNQLVHRDIKPANLLVGKLGPRYDFVKVLDFGLVKPIDAKPEDTQLTDEKSTQGTPAYMPPEVATGATDVDGRTDLYALGCVAYWLVTGKLVFNATTAMAMAIAHATEAPLAPSERADVEVPDDLDRIILRCLSKDPAERYASAHDLAADLAHCAAANGWDNERAASWWSERREAA